MLFIGFRYVKSKKSTGFVSFIAAISMLGIALGAYPIGQFIGAPILGIISDKKGRKNVLQLSLWGTLAGYVLTLFMLKDINSYLTNQNQSSLPVGIIDCIEAGLVAMKIDESRKTGKVIDLTETWKSLDSVL